MIWPLKTSSAFWMSGSFLKSFWANGAGAAAGETGDADETGAGTATGFSGEEETGNGAGAAVFSPTGASCTGEADLGARVTQFSELGLQQRVIACELSTSGKWSASSGSNPIVKTFFASETGWARFK